jgi:hypothetical protein
VAIKRMVRYGSRLSSEGQEKLPALLEAHWKKINANPALVPQGTPWSPDLAGTTIREMPIGDAMSQMHDLLMHSNGLVYVGDNLQDRDLRDRPGHRQIHRLQDPATSRATSSAACWPGGCATSRNTRPTRASIRWRSRRRTSTSSSRRRTSAA